jgi:hypothetical protein
MEDENNSLDCSRDIENCWRVKTYLNDYPNITLFYGPVQPAYNPYFLAYFFSWNSVFLSSEISWNNVSTCFSA